jgi:HK97 family phage portal protein
VRFAVEQEEALPPILHLTLFHPADDHYGLSPMEAAATALDIHNAAGAWNKALLDNAARPSGALVVGGTALTDAQFERLKGELETNYQGAGNTGRPLLLEGGLDWKQMSTRDAMFWKYYLRLAGRINCFECCGLRGNLTTRVSSK